MSKCAAALLFILLAIWIFWLLSDITQIKTEELFLTPLMNDTRGWDIYTVENGSRRELSTEEILKIDTDTVFYLSRILTKEQEKEGYTFLLLDFCHPFAVFIDGELLYTNFPQSNMQIDAVSFPADDSVTPPAPGEQVRCTLPANFAGRRLTVATTPHHSSIPGIILSSYMAESDALIASTGRELMPAAGFAVIALLLSGIWLFAFFQGIRDYPSLLLILAALIQSLSHLRQFTFLTPSFYPWDSPLAVFIPIVEVLLPLVWLLLQMKGKKTRRIFGGILGASAAVAMISPIGGLLGGLPFYSPFLESNHILYVPLAALLVFTAWETIRERNRIFTLLSYGLCMTVCLTAILYFGSLQGEGYYANQIALVFKEMTLPVTTWFFYWCAVILFALSAALDMYQIIQRVARMRTDLALQTEYARQLDNRLSAQKDFYESRLAHEDALRSLRHDMAGHLNTLAMLLLDDKTAEAKNYLDSVTKYQKEQTAKIFCKNPYMNAVLQNYAAKCKEQHIELVCQIGIGEYDLPVTELCLILNNALENALEASLTMPESEKIIKVQATVRQNQLLLRISNRFDGCLTAANGLPVSTKEGEGHGYGLFNIRQAARRRSGHMEYRVRDGYFVLDVTLGIDEKRSRSDYPATCRARSEQQQMDQ